MADSVDNSVSWNLEGGLRLPKMLQCVLAAWGFSKIVQEPESGLSEALVAWTVRTLLRSNPTLKMFSLETPPRTFGSHLESIARLACS